MAHANPYTPGQVETLEQAQNELVKLAAVVNQSIANQKLLQRDDGCLADCAVVPHTLSDEVVRMIGNFELLGAYAARPYQKGQVVTYSDRMYVCVAPHQGGTVMDTASWRLIGKAGCGCEGGGESNPCAPKTTFTGELTTPNQRIDTSNGCMVFYEIKPSALTVSEDEYSGYTKKNYTLKINIALEEGEDITVAMYSDEINRLDYRGYLTFDFGLQAGKSATKIFYGDPFPLPYIYPEVARPFNLLIRASRIGGIYHYRTYLSQEPLSG